MLSGSFSSEFCSSRGRVFRNTGQMIHWHTQSPVVFWGIKCSDIFTVQIHLYSFREDFPLFQGSDYSYRKLRDLFCHPWLDHRKQPSYQYEVHLKTSDGVTVFYYKVFLLMEWGRLQGLNSSSKFLFNLAIQIKEYWSSLKITNRF